MTDDLIAFFDRVKPWHMLLVAIFGVVSWYAGQTGWVGTGPSERFAKIEAAVKAGADQRLVIDDNLKDLQSDVSFTVDLLCLQLAAQNKPSTGDTYLKNRCEDVTNGLGRRGKTRP